MAITETLVVSLINLGVAVVTLVRVVINRRRAEKEHVATTEVVGTAVKAAKKAYSEANHVNLKLERIARMKRALKKRQERQERQEKENS